MRIQGIFHRSALRRHGIDRRRIDVWKENGTLRYVAPFYVTEEAPQDLVALLAHGVRPTCLDAAALHRLWTPPHGGVHVFAPRLGQRAERWAGASAVPIRRGRDGRPRASGPAQRLVLHRPVLERWPDEDPVPELTLVLDHAARCLPAVKAAILLESAVHLGALTLLEAQRVVAGLPQSLRRSLARIRPDAESGTETAVRWWFESKGVRVRSQAPFRNGTRRMDLLVGESWVIECDSRAHHDDPRSYDEDRERDLYLRSLGYHVTRLTWEQVFLRWPRTEAMLLTILRTGDHRRPVRSSAAGRA